MGERGRKEVKEWRRVRVGERGRKEVKDGVK